MTRDAGLLVSEKNISVASRMMYVSGHFSLKEEVSVLFLTLGNNSISHRW